jgi:hypothetical protein
LKGGIASAANGSPAASLGRPVGEFSSISFSQAPVTVLQSSALLQKPTCVELGSASNQSNTKSALDTFSFEEEFPDYRLLHRLSGDSKARLCSEVFDAYLAHCESRLQRDDMAAATVRSYRKTLDGVWRPQIGQQIFYHVCYSRCDRDP